MNAQDLTAKLILWLDQGMGVLMGWLVGPAAWSPCGLLTLTPEGMLARIRLFLLSLTPGAGIDIPFPHRVVELRQAAP